MITYFVLLLGGLLLLYKGADWLVGGASSIANHLGIKPIIIGLTVVAFGTSAPELFVNLTSSFSGQPDIAISNIIGSNIANILLILGVVALIVPLRLRVETVSRQIPLALLAAGLVWVLSHDQLLVGRTINRLDRIDGIILLGFFMVFIYYVISTARDVSVRSDIATRKIWISSLLIGVGLLALSIGGKLTVDGAVGIARLFGLTERFIGLTIIAIGTSLPELLTSVVAALRRQDDIAVGNIVGSNIFNIFWILGLSAAIRPLPVAAASSIDMIVAVAATVLLLTFSFIGKRFLIERWQGAVFVTLYATYILALIL